VAHIGYLREAFVGRRRWLDDGAYGDNAGGRMTTGLLTDSGVQRQLKIPSTTIRISAL